VQIAIALFEGFTALDAVGPYEVLNRIAGAEAVFVGERRGPVRTDTGFLGLVADAGLDEVAGPDVVVVPGGPGQVAHMQGSAVVDWIRSVDEATTWTTSVCTGSLLLGAAGLLRGRRATSHWLALDQLPGLGATPATDRVVFDGKYVTAAGVSSGIDMALRLVERHVGAESAMAIQLGIEYDPEPPFQSGSPAKAPKDLVATLTALKPFILGG